MREKDLIKKLEQQIANIQQFVVDLQQEQKWQSIFVKQKLYTNLNYIFRHNYTDYYKYLENIISDFKIFKKTKDTEVKLYYIEKIQSKIFALFKVLRSLKQYNKTDPNNNYLAEKLSKLLQEKEQLSKMILYINKQYDILYKQFKYKQNQDNNLQQKLLNILVKKGQLEKQLFSIDERLKLYK